MELFDGVVGDMAGSLLSGKSGGMELHSGALLGKGASVSVSATQLEHAIGTTELTQAAMLPQLIDELTPVGDVTPGSRATLTHVMVMLQGK